MEKRKRLTRDEERVKKAERRIARAEAQCHVTIQRAIDRVLAVLRREKTEREVYLTRKKFGVTK